MAKPPAGVDDVFAATMVLLAGTSPTVVTTKAGKVKDRSWDASKKQLLGELRPTTSYICVCRVAGHQFPPIYLVRFDTKIPLFPTIYIFYSRGVQSTFKSNLTAFFRSRMMNVVFDGNHR